MIDLLVVGGGPAGLATALYAARAGLEAVVVEQRPGPVDKACGEGLMPGAVRALEELIGPLNGFPLQGIRYLDDESRCAEARFTHGPGLGVRRTVLHGALEKAARDAGVVLVEGKVGEVHQDGSGVRAGGVRARYLVAADGLHSGIRSAVGLSRAGVRPARYGLRRHFAVSAVDGPGRGDLGGSRRGLRHPGGAGPRRRRRPHLRAGVVRGAPAGVPAACGTPGGAAGGDARAGGRSAAPADAGSGGRAGAARRRCRRLRGRPDRRGHRGVGGQRPGAGAVPAERPAAGLRTGVAAGLAQLPGAHRVVAAGPAATACSGRPWCRPPRGGRGSFGKVVDRLAG